MIQYFQGLNFDKELNPNAKLKLLNLAWSGRPDCLATDKEGEEGEDKEEAGEEEDEEDEEEEEEE